MRKASQKNKLNLNEICSWVITQCLTGIVMNWRVCLCRFLSQSVEKHKARRKYPLSAVLTRNSIEFKINCKSQYLEQKSWEKKNDSHLFLAQTFIIFQRWFHVLCKNSSSPIRHLHLVPKSHPNMSRKMLVSLTSSLCTVLLAGFLDFVSTSSPAVKEGFQKGKQKFCYSKELRELR